MSRLSLKIRLARCHLESMKFVQSIIFLSFLLFANICLAKPIVFSGRITTITNSAVESPQTTFRIKLMNASTCVLYSEEYSLDMTGSNGYFKLTLTAGSPTFQTNGINIFSSKIYTCQDGSSWQAGENDVRTVTISFKDGDSPWVEFSRDTINSVAYANEAESLKGKVPSDFIQSGVVSTQTKFDQIMTQHQSILDLVNGTNSTYAKQNLVDSALSNKQNILSYTPMNPANNLSEISNPSAARSNLGLGTLSTRTSVGDADISNLNWSKLQSIPSAFTPAAHVHSISDVTNLSTSLSSKIEKSAFTCSASESIVYSSVTDTFSCQTISLSGDVTGPVNNTEISKLKGKNLVINNPQDGMTLKFNGSADRWEAVASGGSSSTPKSFAGEVLTFISNCPTGTILADGATLDRSSFQELFNVFDCSVGCPSSVTFKIPDLRGMFLRSKNNGRADGNQNPDGDLALGVVQQDAFKSHTHTVVDPGHDHTITDPGHNHTINDPGHSHAQATSNGAGGTSREVPVGSGTGIDYADGVGAVLTQGSVTSISINSRTTGITVNNKVTGITNNNTGSAETRPKNTTVNYCIRVQNAY